MFLADFTLEQTVSQVSSKGFPLKGIAPLQTVDTIFTEEEYVLTASVQSVDELDIHEFIFGQKSATQTSFVAPYVYGATIPATAPYEIASDPAAPNAWVADQVIDVTIVSDAGPGKTILTQEPESAPSTPVAGNYAVEAGKIVFNAAQAGQRVCIYYRDTVASGESVGADVFDEIGEFEMFGQYAATRTRDKKIWCPRCKFNDGFSFQLTADSFDRTMLALVPTDLGWVLPYRDWAV
jgi:hypothetical protein